MNIKYISLDNRAIIYIKGDDRRNFLQGLITNDVNNIVENSAVYAAILNPQGRYLFDFFVIQNQNEFLLDCAKSSTAELIKKLSFYKLRSKVEIGIKENLSVASVLDGNPDFIGLPLLHFTDPRNIEMGIRIIGSSEQLAELVKFNNLSEANLDLYNYRRMKLKIADDHDLTYDQSLILEYDFDNLNAIDYKKGCYVGQEVTARTHYRGVIRKKIYLVQIVNLKAIAGQSEITCDGKKAGIILSSLFYDNKLIALALIKNIDNDGREIDLKNADLQVENNKLTLIS